MLGNENYANEFDKLIAKYTFQEQNKILHILNDLVSLYKGQQETNDIMLKVFEKLEIGNKKTGQFFTPTHISNCMAKIDISLSEVKKAIEENGYISLQEPTCRSWWNDISICK